MFGEYYVRMSVFLELDSVMQIGVRLKICVTAWSSWRFDPFENNA